MDLEKLEERLEKKRQQFEKVRVQLRNLEHDRDDLIKIPKMKKLIGKCFKYRNSYGGDSQDWWLYIYVRGVKGTDFITDQFQTCSDGRIEIELNKRTANVIVESGRYIETKEYEKALKKMKDALALLSL